MEPILTIDNLNSFGGNMLRQGDKSQLKYRLRDVGNKNLSISGKPCEIKMYGGNYTTVVYETTATVSSDNTVSFTIDNVLPKGTFYLEFTVGDYIFPTDHREFFEITPSGKGMEANIIEIVGVDAVVRKAVDLINEDPSLIIDEDKLVSDIISNTGIGNINEYYKAFNDLKPKAEQSITKSAEALTKSQNALNVANGIDAKATNALSLSESADTLSKSVQEQFNQVVIDGDSSVEAAQARVDASGETNATLKARLDKEHNEVTAQLAQKAKQVDLEVERQRINNLSKLGEGSTTGDAELMDGRVGDDGKTYDNLGDANRQQFSKVKFDLERVSTELDPLYDKSTNLYNKDTRLVSWWYTESGELIEDNRYTLSDYIPAEENTTYSYTGIARINYFDQNKRWIGLDWSEVTIPTTKTTPPDTRFIRIGSTKARMINDDTRVNLGAELLPYEPYYKKLTLRDFEVEIIGDTYIKSTNLELEADGLSKVNGKIKPTNENEIRTDMGSVINYYKTTYRTKKYLKVVQGSEVILDFDDGEAFIFEYDRAFNFIKSTNVSAGGSFNLSGSTTFIKVMLENCINLGTHAITYTSDRMYGDDWVFNNRADDNVGNINSTSPYINFIYETGTNEGRSVLEPDGTEMLYTEERYFNAGLLRLPPNYKTTGEPVKLIFYAHGSSDLYQFYQKNIGYAYENVIDYLVDEGYAVFGIFDWTTKYYPDKVTYGGNLGSPIVYSAIASAYNWITENYNIDRDGIFVTGKSAGGYQGFGLAHNKGLHVRAIGMMAPTISPMTTRLGEWAWLRKAMAEDYGFEGDYSVLDDVSTNRTELHDFFMNNAEKMVGYNSYWDGIINANATELMEYAYDRREWTDYNLMSDLVRVIPVPVKIWAAKDDHIASLEPQYEIYIKSIKNGHGIGELRWLPDGTGGHNAVDNSPDALKVTSITTRLGETHTNVPLSYVELVSWFRRFGG